MAIPVRGFTGSIGIGTEVTYGTEAARDRWMRVHEAGLQRNTKWMDVGTLGAIADASTNEQHRYQESEECGGRIVVPFAYNDMSLSLLHQIMGATVVEAGGGPFTHTFKLGSPPPIGLTIEQVKGAHASLSTSQEFYGCKLNSMELSCEAGRHMMASFDVISKSAGALQAVPAPTYGTPTFANHNHMTAPLTADAIPRQINSFSLSVNRNLSRNYELGSLTTSEPYESRMSVELNVDTLWQQNNWHSEFYAGTFNDFTWSFSTAAVAIAFTLHNGLVVEHSDVTSGPEGIRQSAKIRGYSSGGTGNQGLTIVITNANALFSAN